MYQSLSNLLRETQTAAAKKLWILENDLAEDLPDAPLWTDEPPIPAATQGEPTNVAQANPFAISEGRGEHSHG